MVMMADNEFIQPETLHYVWDGHRLYLPYPGGHRVGGEAAALHVVSANHGFQVVAMNVDFAEEGHRCDMRYSHSEPNYGAHYECAICGAKTP
jgi:hypothetical protein